MKPIAIIATVIATASGLAPALSAAELAYPKRVMVQMVSNPKHIILEVGFVVITRDDTQKTFADLVEKQVGPRWWPFTHASVYRFSDSTNAWELVMTRDTSTTKTVVGVPLPGLVLDELRSGDVVRLTGGWVS